MRYLWMCMSVTALLIGALLYGLFRQETWIGSLMGKTLDFPLLAITGFRKILAWYLPDFLWGYSLVGALLAVKPKHMQTSVCCTVAAAYGLAWEFLQLCGVVGGTADLWDCIMYIMAACLAFMIEITIRRVKS